MIKTFTHSSSNRVKNQDSSGLPPFSLEAEQAVIGALMLDMHAWDRVIDRLSTNDFYRHEHQLLFQVIGQLMAKNHAVDVLTVTEALKITNKLEEVGGEAYLFELAQNTPTAANVLSYADIVRERSILRNLSQVGRKIIENSGQYNNQDVQEILDQAERDVLQIAEQRTRGSGPVKISTLLAKTTDRIDALFHSGNEITGVATGYLDLDRMTSGLQPGDLVIIAGRPSMGKTTFAINIAEYVAIDGKKPVLIFSLEMPAESLTMRMMSSLGRIDQHKIRTGKLNDDDWPRIANAVSLLSNANMYIDDTPALTPHEVRSRSRRIAREHKNELGLIVIDYLQLMRVGGVVENRTAEISEISRSLKTLAKELNVPVIALSQLNRSLEQRSDRRPVMSDLRESGAIEQDADLIAFIYRDEVYNEDSPDKGIAEIIIRKQRNGPIGDFRLTFLGHYTRFENHAGVQSLTDGYL